MRMATGAFRFSGERVVPLGLVGIIHPDPDGKTWAAATRVSDKTTTLELVHFLPPR